MNLRYKNQTSVKPDFIKVIILLTYEHQNIPKLTTAGAVNDWGSLDPPLTSRIQEFLILKAYVTLDRRRNR